MNEVLEGILDGGDIRETVSESLRKSDVTKFDVSIGAEDKADADKIKSHFEGVKDKGVAAVSTEEEDGKHKVKISIESSDEVKTEEDASKFVSESLDKMDEDGDK